MGLRAPVLSAFQENIFNYHARWEYYEKGIRLDKKKWKKDDGSNSVSLQNNSNNSCVFL